MLTFNNTGMRLVMQSAGKEFEVTAICNTVEEANNYCEANPGEGVIDEDRQQGRVYIAKEKGSPVHLEPEERAGLAGVLLHRFDWLGTDDDAGSGADVISELGDLYEELLGGKMAGHSSIDAANRGFLAGTADKIDRILKKEDAEDISTEDMIDELAGLRDRIKDHLKPQCKTRQQKNAPTITWTKPLTPCGPDTNPKVKLLGTVEILGSSFHAEAYEIEGQNGEPREQTGKQHEDETYLAEILNIVQGAAATIVIDEREYVLAITPSQR